MKSLSRAVEAALYNRVCRPQAVDNEREAYQWTPQPETGFPPENLLFPCGYNTEFPTTPCSDKDVLTGVLKAVDQKK